MTRIDATAIKVGDVIEMVGDIDLHVEWHGKCANGDVYIAGHKSTNAEPQVILISAGGKLDVVQE
jgi:hypothetical protein